jgi:23S rRNA (cytosine1962-C5)-methyltransferase
MTSIILKRGREKNLLQRHPWIFSGAIERVERSVQPFAGQTAFLKKAGCKQTAMRCRTE